MFVQGHDGFKGDKGTIGLSGKPGVPGLRGKDVSKSRVAVTALIQHNSHLFYNHLLKRRQLSMLLET